MTDRKLTPTEAAMQALTKAEAALALNQETNEMVKEIHDAWMKPHPVYGNKSLLEVLSSLAARASAGEIVGARVVWWAGILAALGTISAAFYAAVHLGQSK